MSSSSSASGRDPLGGLTASGVFVALGTRYRMLERLGQGSFGVVFRALDLEHQREVALKLLYDPSERRKARFLREGKVVGKLVHHHVLPVHDLGEVAGVLYLAQRFVPGVTPLGELAPLPIARAARIVRDVARAAHHAHERGVIHRDIKPDNVLVGADDHAYLIDFGLASDDDQARLTRTGMGLGTLAFSAPEQLGGARADARADVYGLGATLYWALTGEMPIELEDDPMALYREVPQPPSLRRRGGASGPGIPADLDALCLRCLEKQPQDRYASAAELADALDAFLSGGRARLPRRRLRPGPVWVLLAAGAAGGLLWLGTRGEGTAPRAADPTPVGPRVGPAPPAGPVNEQGVRSELARARLQEEAGEGYGVPLETLARAAAGAGRDPRLLELIALARAGYLLRKGDAERALREVERAQGGAARLLRARALLRLDRRPEAEAQLEALERADAGPLGRVGGGLLRFSRREHEAGADLAKQALADLARRGAPGNGDPELEEQAGLANLVLGINLLGLNEAARAAEALQAAVEALPLDPIPRGALARALLDLGRERDAAQALDAAIARGEPRPPAELLRLRGVTRARRRHAALEETLADLDRALTARPEDAEALFWRGVTKLRVREGTGGASGAQAKLEGARAEEDLARSRILDPQGSSEWLMRIGEAERIPVSAAMGLGR